MEEETTSTIEFFEEKELISESLQMHEHRWTRDALHSQQESCVIYCICGWVFDHAAAADRHPEYLVGSDEQYLAFIQHLKELSE